MTSLFQRLHHVGGVIVTRYGDKGNRHPHKRLSSIMHHCYETESKPPLMNERANDVCSLFDHRSGSM
jgi:hypothetical protein